MERLRFIERAAFWTGVVNRSDLQSVFGVSQAQASADLQKFQGMNPGALLYNLNRKRYEGAVGMRCEIHQPRLEEAMAQFLGEAVVATPLVRASWQAEQGVRLAAVTLPVREAGLAVQRAVFQGVLHGLRVRVNYHSLTGKSEGWRWLAPHAFAHDGYRWHVRAWCEKREAFRDFVLSRMKAAELPTEVARVGQRDEDWETWEELVLAPAAGLSEAEQKTVALDFAMRGGKLRLQVRKAMRGYTLGHLRLGRAEFRTPDQMLEVVE
jgi:hypothetical protein